MSCEDKIATKYKVKTRGVSQEERDELKVEMIAEAKKTQRYRRCDHTISGMNIVTKKRRLK